MSRADWFPICALLALFACTPSDSEIISGEPTTMVERHGVNESEALADQPHIVTPSGVKISLEIARSDAQRARGLMFRESLPENHGMLFVFTETEHHGFWMKNTFIPLDMLWIEDDGTVAEIKRGVPPCLSDPCPTYAPDSPGRYVLELASGEADRLGIREGDRFELRNIEPPNGG